MPWLIVAALTLAVLWLVRALWSERRRIERLRMALAERRVFLLDDDHTEPTNAWTRLVATVNESVRTLQQVSAQRDRQLQQFEATLRSLQEGVIIVDENNQLRLANQSLLRLLPQLNAAGHPRIETALHSTAFLEFLQAVRAGTAKPAVEVELLDGEESHSFEITAVAVHPWTGEEGSWVLCVLHDVTRQRRLENVRKEFVANVSHELRTPLSVIKGYVETLVDGGPEMPAADRDKFLRTIQRHADRLHNILEDLLSLSRLESKNPGLLRESVDLPALLRQFAADYAARVAASHHELLLALPEVLPAVFADRVKLTQVFENLVDNALKYTPGRSTITISIEWKSREMLVRVVDNGPGIPAVDLPHIFERFYRVDKGRSREKGGTGLGLSIVKHIVQLHGGRVWAESTPGQGTAVSFTLPAAS